MSILNFQLNKSLRSISLYEEGWKRNVQKNKLVISALLVICLIGINFFVFRKTAANVQNKKAKEKSVKGFASNYKLEIKTIKKGMEDDMYIPLTFMIYLQGLLTLQLLEIYTV